MNSYIANLRFICIQFAKAIMLNEPLPTRIKDLYRLQNNMAVELLNASGMEEKHVREIMLIHITT